jgi:hypothetical protein
VIGRSLLSPELVDRLIRLERRGCEGITVLSKGGTPRFVAWLVLPNGNKLYHDAERADAAARSLADEAEAALDDGP